MSEARRIRDIDDPELFQRLVHAVLVAEYGSDIQLVDDSGGDGGMDAYRRSTRTLYAIYCPQKPANDRQYKNKIREDLDKAVRLREQGGYEITTWCFVTPHELREPVLRFLRGEAQKRGFEGISLGEQYLNDLFNRHPHLHDQFPSLASPRLLDELESIKTGISELRAAVEKVTVLRNYPYARALNTFNQGKPAGRLKAIWHKIASGDLQEGLEELDRLLLETGAPEERVWGTILYLQSAPWATKVDALGETLARIEMAIQWAMQLGDNTALAILKAEKAWALSWQATELDMQTYYQALASNVVGLPLVSAEHLAYVSTKLKQMNVDAEKLFQEAINLAEGNLQYDVLIHVLVLKAGAICSRLLFYRNVPELQLQAQVELSEMHRLYQAAIQLAVALKDAYSLAVAYHNYANSLRSLGDLRAALPYAKRAQEFAKTVGDKDLETKTAELLMLLTGAAEESR